MNYGFRGRRFGGGTDQGPPLTRPNSRNPPLTGAARGSARARLLAAACCAAPVPLQPDVGAGKGGPQPEAAAQRQPEGDVGGGCGPAEGRGSRVMGRGQRGVGQRAGSRVAGRGQRGAGQSAGSRVAGRLSECSEVRKHMGCV